MNVLYKFYLTNIMQIFL